MRNTLSVFLHARTHARPPLSHNSLWEMSHTFKVQRLKKKKELCYMITSPTTPCSQNMSKGLACKAQHPACKHVWAPTTGAFSSSRRAAKLWFHMWLDEDGGSRQRKLRCLSNISAQSWPRSGYHNAQTHTHAHTRFLHSGIILFPSFEVTA